MNRAVTVGSDGGGLAEYAEQTGDVMARDDTGLYLYAGHIHELRRTMVGSVRFERVNAARIGLIVQDQRRAGRYVVAVDKRGQPKQLPATLIGAAIDTFRDLAAHTGRIVSVQTRFPVMQRAANGTWAAFRESTADVYGSILIMPDRRYMAVPVAACDEQVRYWVDALMAPFREFPFADNRHRALTLAAALMACTRPTMQTAPAVIVEAPIPRSGKTLLAETLGMLTPGRDDTQPVATSIPKSEEEIEKKLAAFAGDASPAVLFDNLHAALYSPAIEALITAGSVTVRPMGQNDATEKRTLRALLLFTGNNAIISDDLRRRALNIRLDARTARPQDVIHGFDPYERVAQQRGHLAAAAIGILEHVQRGAPAREQWMRDVSPDFADLIAPAVRYVCAQMPDGYEWPADVVEESLTDESNAGIVEAVIRGFVDSPHLVGAAKEYMKASEMTAMPPFAIVREMLEGMAKPQKFNAITLGRFLKRFRDNPSALGTLRVVPKSATRATAGWRIEFTDEFRQLQALREAEREAENEAARALAMQADPLQGI